MIIINEINNGEEKRGQVKVALLEVATNQTGLATMNK